MAQWDAYPPGQPTVTGPASPQYPWVGDDFDSYSGVARLESSSTKSSLPHLDVTSGSLWSVQDAGNGQAFTTDNVFRMVANGWLGQDKIQWTDQIGHYRARIDSWHGGLEDWSGLHMFGRYQTSDDLYVVSMRYDGTATIKKKINTVYSTLASGPLPAQYVNGTGHLLTGTWFDLKFSIIGNELSFLIDDEEILTVTDNDLAAGTIGIRTDNSTVYFDDWGLLHPASVLAGDLDGDGFVGIADLNIVLGNWNQSVTAGDPLAGDPSGDGFVGIVDLNEVLGNWNAGTPPVIINGASIPEPGIALIGFVLTGVLSLSRRLRPAAGPGYVRVYA
jgi:hypothetical protein